MTTNRRPAPFLIRLRLRDGRVRTVASPDPSAAQHAVARLASRPELDAVCWMPHPALAGPVRLIGRYTADVPGIGSLPRVAHLFLLQPGARIGPHDPVTALCGEPIRADQLDILSTDGGRPCYRCRVRTPETPS
jgi:hypothetical protein